MAEFPYLIRPMLAVAADLPADEALWAAEFKWDGVRAPAYLRGGTVRLMSRGDRDITEGYPELAALSTLTGREAVLDGEIVAFDDEGRPDFAALQHRMHVRAPSRRLIARFPVAYYAFDLLHLDGVSTLRMPYTDRRHALEALDPGDPLLRLPPSFPGAARAVLHAARSRRLEGVVCKRLDSPYLPGRRSGLWRKTKILQSREVVVGGWKPGAGRRSQTLGSLLVGIPHPAGLRYCGHVGTGFTDATLRDLTALMRSIPRATSPFTAAAGVPREHAALARWVEPVLVGEVGFAEWTTAGVLRHPVWRGLRPDKEPGEVTEEAT
ncbi:non-homologous end-joining DNA ligase [Rhizohabitans arisaemae]|uniref:non-homologous end-joining DNA ligase n=1 Tax=Rhizohabitans arisaemae TaxID=2720610 RepID=UPI0024B2671C|nr:non-homologous end-joining DNA ligase [Rhizohabitans arisaemae]